MYIKTSATNCSQTVIVGFERTVCSKTSISLFYYNWFSAGNTKSMWRLRRKIVLPIGQWQSNYIFDKKPTTALHQQNGL